MQSISNLARQCIAICTFDLRILGCDCRLEFARTSAGFNPHVPLGHGEAGNTIGMATDEHNSYRLLSCDSIFTKL